METGGKQIRIRLGRNWWKESSKIMLRRRKTRRAASKKGGAIKNGGIKMFLSTVYQSVEINQFRNFNQVFIVKYRCYI